MTIREQIDEINKFFADSRERYKYAASIKDAAVSSYASKAEQIRRNYQHKRTDIGLKRDEVLKFYRIAKDNTRAELTTVGKQPKSPDINLLSEMLYKINENDYNDATASKIVELIGSYIVFFDNQIKEIDRHEKNELNQLEAKRLSELSVLESRKQAVLKVCSDYLASADIRNLRKLLDNLDNDFGFSKNQIGRKINGLNRTLPYGYQQIPLYAPSNLQKEVHMALGGHYIQNNVDCPCGFNFSTYTYINAEYIPCTESDVRNGIRALVINTLRSVPIRDIRISIFDSINYSASLLGDMSQLAGLPGGSIESVAQNEGDLRHQIKALAEYYQKVERKIGNNNVFNYNKNVSSTDRIPLRLMIVNKEAKAYNSTTSEMSYLLSNAYKLGITVVELSCNRDGGSKDTDKEKNIFTNVNGEIKIISDKTGRLYKIQDKTFSPFRWHQAPDRLPKEYVTTLESQIQRKKTGPDYFSYFSLKIPEKSFGKRKAIIVPFARDENDVIVNSSFENENFAAYMMGASRSGKSTLLHVMICSLITNYHPDEVELWLVDFKRTEFRHYSASCPPHLKYLLLEESEDLIFDLIDELTDVLNDRMKIFSNNGWSKLSEVPPDVYMPAIFVIIDEFAQVSQKLRDSQLSGGTNYVIALENILAKGAAFGMKFIFASQSYNTGVEGLSQTARKQIQMRFALKNTADEVKDTLNLNSYQMTDRIMQLISSIQVYETLFKRVDEGTGAQIVDKYFNLKVEMKELLSAIDFLNSNLHPTSSDSGKSTYINKHPVLLIDDKPSTFKSMVPQYVSFEKTMSKNKYYSDTDPDDILLYLGIPCSFKQVKPISLKCLASQNILTVGGDRDSQASLLLSIINSWKKKDRKLSKFEIWTHEQYPTFKKYRKRWEHARCKWDIEEIAKRTEELINDIYSGRSEDRLIVCMGLDLLYEDFDDYKSLPKAPKKPDEPKDITGIDLWELMNAPDVNEEQIKEYNETAKYLDTPSFKEVADFHRNMELLLSKASKKGVHFAFFFMRYRDYRISKLGDSECQHKILFSMPKAESKDIACIDASDLNEGEFVYSDGYRTFNMRPHIYNGIPCNGWIIENGEVTKI